MFCAHVTGNFVLFAASVAKGVRNEDFLKLLTFPVFIVGVVVATTLIHRIKVKEGDWLRRLLQSYSSLLLLAGFCTFAHSHIADVAATMILVFALAMQNTIHHFIKGLTTVMTGSVMNTSVGLAEKHLLKECPQNTPTEPNPTPGVKMILAFLLGCTLSGVATTAVGFRAILLAGLAMVGVILRNDV